MLNRIFLLFILTIILSCFLTPAVYSAALALLPVIYPYSRIYDRVLLLILIVLVIIFRRHLPSKQLLATLKTEAWSKHISLALIGSGLTFSCALLGVGYIAYASAADWTGDSFGDVLLHFLKTLPVALVVSLLEEAVFRVIIFTALISQLGIIPAAFFSSLLYAVVHFVSPDKSYIYTGYSFFVGFDYVFAVLARLALPGVIYGVMGLFLIGLFQCAALKRSGSIYLSVGMHAGWILAAKVSAKFLNLDAVGIESGLGTRYFLVGNPIGWLCILISGLIMLFLTRKKTPVLVVTNA